MWFESVVRGSTRGGKTDLSVVEKCGSSRREKIQKLKKRNNN